MIKPKIFAFLFLIFAACAIALFASFNYLVDSYGIYSGQRALGFSKFPRLVKPWVVIDKDIPNIFIGNSRSAYGINPAEVDREKYSYTYNFSVLGSSLYDFYRMLQHAYYANAGYENIYINIDYVCEGNAVNNLGAGFEESDLLLEKYNIFHELNRLMHLFKVPFIVKERVWDKNGWYEKFDEFSFISKGYARSLRKREEKTYSNYKNLDSDCITGQLEDLLNFSYKNKLPFVIYSSPKHIRNYIAAYNTPALERLLLQNFLLVDLNERLAKKYHAKPFRTVFFSGINAYNSEKFPMNTNDKNPMAFWYENSHYKPTLGKLVIEKLFDPNKEGYGIELTTENVKKFNDSIVVFLNKYIENNPLILKQVKQRVH